MNVNNNQSVTVANQEGWNVSQHPPTHVKHDATGKAYEVLKFTLSSI
jgi:hypothetical protein